jgi:diguanylate cyclase (GGDEF)-like protein
MWKALLVLLLGCPLCATAAPAIPLYGQPLQQRFGVAQHDASPSSHAVLPLPDGSVLVANSAGVLHFDGSHWELFELPGLSPARALLHARDGSIYVGGYDQFGRLETDPNGRFRYVDLRPEFGVAGSDAVFGVIWDIVETTHGIYWRSDETLFFLGHHGERERWPLGLDFRRLAVVDEVLYIRRHGAGFGSLDRDGFRLAPGGERFAEQPLTSTLKHPDGVLLVAADGFYLADARGIRALASASAASLVGLDPNASLRLPDGSLVLGSGSGELAHLDADLNLLSRHRLGSYSVLALAQDREGGIWAATEGDLVRLRLPSPWSAYSSANGLQGSPLDTAYGDGVLWVATSMGVFRSQRQDGQIRFEHAIDTSLEASTLLATPVGLLIGDREGLLWHHGEPARTERLLDANTVFDLIPSRFHPGRVFVLADDAVLVLQQQADRWRVLNRWPLDGMGVAVLHEADATTLWLDDWRGAPQRWQIEPESAALQARQSFGREAGVEVDPVLGSTLFALDERLYVVSGSRVYRQQGERFEPFAGPPFSLFPRPFEIGLSHTAHGEFAYSDRLLYRRLPGTDDWQLVALGGGIARGFFDMQTDADGRLRVKTWGGLLQFDPSIAEPALVPLSVSLSGWSLRQPESPPQALPLTGASTLILGSSDLLSFDFRMPTMDPGVEFRYRIDGLDSAWSDWLEPGRPSLSLRAPGPGDYRLRVEGRTRNGRVGAPLSFEFSVRPDWWQTGWAQLGAASAVLLLFLLGAQLAARLRYRQVLAANRHLEQKIAERTQELEQANRKLAELATEDSLTGVANRRALEQALNREWERCGELRQPLTLIMIDVDHFKRFNDSHGHLEGDKQLIRVARELAGRVRPVRELLARFGGEEFAVILPGTGMQEALARAETMRAAFDRDSFPTTVSVGVAAAIPSAERSPTDLLRDADTALYAAKRQGRNRVISAAA